jgi:hypothetical protein
MPCASFVMNFPRNLFMGRIPHVYRLLRLLVLSLLLVQQGCTSSPSKPWTPHVTEDVRTTIHTIGLAVAVELPLVINALRVTVESPSEDTTATYAKRKACNWSAKWLTSTGETAGVGAKMGDLGIFVITTTAGAMLVVTPVVAAAGAVAGAIEAPSSEETQVHSVFKVEDMIHRLQNHVLKHVTDWTDISVIPLLKTANDPLGGQEIVPTRGSQPDALLRIQLKSIDLRGSFDVDPLLALNLDVQVTLVASSVSTPLYMHSFHYVTGARRLTEWIVDDNQGFRETVDLSLARLAELMVDNLFLIHPFNYEHRRVRDGS